MIAITTNRNFGLTEAEFYDLTQMLQQGDESLFETLFVRHYKPSMGILIKKYQASQEAAYDAVMWAMLRMRQLLLEEKVAYGNLEAYLTRMSVNHYLKSQGRNKEYSTDILPETLVEQEELQDPETQQILEKAWSKMGSGCQELLKGFYYDKTELKKLTVILGDSSEANTRKKKERCLIELRSLFFRFYTQ